MARDIHQWINDYGISHQNSTNKKIHWICVPAIMFTLLGLLSLVKFDLGEFRVNLVYILIVLAWFFYLRLSLCGGSQAGVDRQGFAKGTLHLLRRSLESAVG